MFAMVYECHVRAECVQGALLIRCTVLVLLVERGMGAIEERGEEGSYMT